MSETADKTFYLETFGCQMNAHDSEKVVGYPTLIVFPPSTGCPPALVDETLAGAGVHILLGSVTQ
jgi:hypothetical protein